MWTLLLLFIICNTVHHCRRIFRVAWVKLAGGTKDCLKWNISRSQGCVNWQEYGVFVSSLFHFYEAAAHLLWLVLIFVFIIIRLYVRCVRTRLCQLCGWITMPLRQDFRIKASLFKTTEVYWAKQCGNAALNEIKS